MTRRLEDDLHDLLERRAAVDSRDLDALRTHVTRLPRRRPHQRGLLAAAAGILLVLAMGGLLGTRIPLGTTIHNIELIPGKGGQIVRSAGVSAQLLAKEGELAQVRLPSGEVRRVPIKCMATIGQVSNVDHENQSLGKAGRARHMGQRPEVRGVAMTPRDHPHGGGEGKSPTGMPPKTPWGKPAMGYRTRRAKTTGRLIVRSRHRK